MGYFDFIFSQWEEVETHCFSLDVSGPNRVDAVITLQLKKISEDVVTNEAFKRDPDELSV